MKSSVMKQRFRAGTAVLVVLMLILSVFPSGIFNNKVEAANNITIYFDTYRDGASEADGWLNAGPVNIYIWYDGSPGVTKQMDETDIVSQGGSDYKVFKYTWDQSQYNCFRFYSSTGTTSNTGSGSGNRGRRSAMYKVAEIGDNNCYKVTGEVISNTNRVTTGFKITPPTPSVVGYTIKKSESGKNKDTFHDSRIILDGDSQDNGNVKSNGNYLVGEYKYTGKYLTYKSEFFDYLSDEEISGTWNSISNSNSNGYTDPFTTLNMKISGEVGSTKNQIQFVLKNLKVKNKNATNFSLWKLHVWRDGGELLTSWPGATGNSYDDGDTYEKTFTNLTIGSNYKAILTYNTNTTRIDFTNNFTPGHKYVIDVDRGSVAEMPLVEYSSTNSYSYPLYFGCFWLSNWSSYYTDISRGTYNNFYWPANISVRNDRNDGDTDKSKDYMLSASIKGLVGQSLSNDNLTDPGNSNVILPYLNKSWADSNSTVARYWTDIDFPFYEIKLEKDKDGNSGDSIKNTDGEFPTYYQFNSRDKASLYLDVTANSESGNKVLNEHSNSVKSQLSTLVNAQTKGFYPFNTTNSTDNGKNNNLGFGVKYEIPFVLTEDGKIKGVDTTFEFMGDDDVWVFIDDNLVLDMGGDHKDAYGKINFALDKSNTTLECSGAITTTTGNTTTINSLQDVANSLAGNNKGKSTTDFQLTGGSYTTDSNGNKIYDTKKVHYLKMFFMERGMLESDCFIRFNFTKLNILNIKNNVKIDDTVVNKGLVNKTLEAANYDSFVYQLENTAIKTRQEESGTNGLFYKGGRKSAQRQVNSITNTLTGLNPATVATSKSDKTEGNFNQQPGTVNSTYFERYDDYFVKKSTDDEEKAAAKYVTGTTNESGKFDLLFGQTSSFKYQFYSYSTINIVQQDKLDLLKNRTDATVLEDKGMVDTANRLASKYYKTTWTLKDVVGTEIGKNTSANAASTSGVSIADNERATGNDDLPVGTTNLTFQNAEAKSTVGVNLTAEYVNQPLTGGLEIKKQIVTKGTTTVDTDDLYNDEFTIRVKFKDVFGQDSTLGNVQLTQESDYTGIKYTIDGVEHYMEYDSTNNCGTIKLKRNETAIISKIPVDTAYEITEDAQDYHELDSLYVNNTKVSGNTATGTISATTTTPATVNTYDVNNTRRLGSLEIEKQVASEGNNNTAVYQFTVAFATNYNDSVTYDDFDLTVYSSGIQSDNTVTGTGNITWGTATSTGLTATVTLKHGEKATITKIPYGARYTVTETGNNSGTFSYYTNSQTNSTGTIASATTSDIVTNTRQTGSLALSKVLKESNGTTNKTDDTTTNFEFTVTLAKPADLSSWSGYTFKIGTNDVTLDGNTFTVNLRAGETKTVTGLPYGTTYTVEETNTGSYQKVATVYGETAATKIINSTNDDTVTITNKVQDVIITMPSTGGTIAIFLLPFGIVAITLAGVAVVIYRKKLSGEPLTIKSRGGRYRK